MHLKITLRSAQIFKSVTFFSKMYLYAVVNGPSSSRPQTTKADMHSGANPFWMFPMEFDVDESKLATDANVVVRVKCRRSVMIGSDKSVGSVSVAVKALLEYYWMNAEGNQPENIALTITSRSGKPRGVLYLSYMFGDDEKMDAPDGAPPISPLPIPSAPPLALQDCEDYGYALQDCEYYGYEYRVTPSAPYLSQDYSEVC